MKIAIDRIFNNINSLNNRRKAMTKHLSIFNNLRPFTVGFDDWFDHFDTMLGNPSYTASNFPPYNIVKTGEYTYDVELALAGFNRKDIDVEYHYNLLTVKSKKQEETKDEDGNVIQHRGISKRMFSKSFTIANDVEVKGAELKDGLLKVSMERIIPEHKKAKLIDIK